MLSLKACIFQFCPLKQAWIKVCHTTQCTETPLSKYHLWQKQGKASRTFRHWASPQASANSSNKPALRKGGSGWKRQRDSGHVFDKAAFCMLMTPPSPNTDLQLQRAPHTFCLYRGFPPPLHISLVAANLFLPSPPDIWRSLLSYCFWIFVHLDISYTQQLVLFEVTRDKIFVFYLN